MRLYRYPRFIGGPAAKKKVPEFPSDRGYIEIATGPTHSFVGELDEAPPLVDFLSTTYSKHRGGFGRDRMVEFWADSRLSGEDAFDQLVTDMFSRCGVRREN